MVDYNEAIGLEGFEEIEDFELRDDEAKGIAAICGIVCFPPNLASPGGAPGFVPKYGIDIMVPKGGDDAALLFAVAKDVATRRWGADSEKEYDICLQVANGMKGRSLNFNLKDGDILDPEYNQGFWVLGARSEDQPVVLDADGRIVSNPGQFPGQNWGVRAVIEFWAQPSRDRINTRLLAVQAIAPGVRRVGRTPEQTKALVMGAVAKLPALPSPSTLQVAAGRPVEDEPEPQAPPARRAPQAPAQPAQRRRQAASEPAPEPAAKPARRRSSVPVGPTGPDGFFRRPEGDDDAIEVEAQSEPEAPAAPAPATPRRRVRVANAG